MDNLVFEESVNTELDSSEFVSKRWIYVNDSNASNYTSQVVIDSTPLANAGGYINWQEGYILMPLVVQLSSSAVGALPISAPATDDELNEGTWNWAFKNSFIQMINSMNIEFNNSNLVQSIPLTNVFRTFKLLTSYSQDDLTNNSTNYGFYPDTVDGWDFQTADSKKGLGLCNNNPSYIRTTATAPYSMLNENSGIYKRNRFWNYNPLLLGQGRQGLINGEVSSTTVYRSGLVSATDGSRVWHIYAKLRLKDLNEFFEKSPLLKGSTIRFYLNTNQSIVNFTSTGGVFSAVSVGVLGGLTNPLMLLEQALGTETLDNQLTVNGAYSLSVSIFRNNNTVNNQGNGNCPNSALQSCRLYAPIYKFNPIAEQRYLSLTPTKKIDYNDIFQYQFSNIGKNQTFNFLVSNGISNIQSVLVVPLIAAGGNYTTPLNVGPPTPSSTDYGNLTDFNTLLSPFTTTGGTPDPLIISNFNIQISGVNLFLNNQLFDFEVFTQQLVQSNQLNGDLTTGLTSGLISEDAFQRGFRYYYGNAARQLPSESGVSRSVNIVGQNVSKCTMNILVFVEFKRSITIDIMTGARIE